MRVVILGKGLMLANLILGAKDAGADIVGVFRYEETCTTKWKLFLQDFFKPAPEVTLINELRLNKIHLKSANSEQFKKMMIALNVDLIIVGTWRERLSKEIFNIPKIATVNVHPSLLPQYRGPNPYMQTILHGENCSGVTLHLMDERYDSGSILKQKKVEIQASDTSKELRERSVVVARSLITEFLTDLNDRILTPIAQSEKYATYFQNISGDERMLDFEVQSSEEISRTIRALHPFLPTYITYKKQFFVVNPYKFEILPEITNCKAGEIVAKNSDTKSIIIACADKRLIRFTDLTLYKASLLTKFYIAKFVKVTCEQ